jgi:hypothetical protein
MKTNRWFILAGVLLLLAPAALADQVELKDGTKFEGIVQKVEQGQVTILVGSETKVFDILQVTNIDFDSARMTEGTKRLPLEHFLSSMEAQEMVSHFQHVETAAAEVRKLLDQTKNEWADRNSVTTDQTARWYAAKERFSTPMADYQEALNELYFHVLGKVDEYNSLMKEADSIYVGVKGWFNVGSSLIPPSVKKLPLKKYVPATWYDTIFYDGYNQGYNEAYEKYGEHYGTRD